tara:strand:- start:570 stop:749 length:180 start_codon:yes stop_codon:yes gene_type:complete
VSDRQNFENAFPLFPLNQKLPFLPKLYFACHSVTFSQMEKAPNLLTSSHQKDQIGKSNH